MNNFPPITLAIVEDSLSLQKFLKSYLSDQGFIVTCQAYNGQEFLAHLEQAPPPDLVLLDTNMPLMNGYETATHLKAKYPSINILIYSFQCDDKRLDDILSGGVYGFVTKEAEPDEIRDKLLELYAKSAKTTVSC